MNPEANHAAAEISRAAKLSVLLVTDIVGSVALQGRLGTRRYAGMIVRYEELFNESLRTSPGSRILNFTGDGHVAEFSTCAAAVTSALYFQHRLLHEDWGHEAVLIRAGIDVGEIVEIGGGLDQGRHIGMAINLASRLMSLAEPGQILLARGVFADARLHVREHPFHGENGQDLPLSWPAHGRYLFQGEDEPTEVFEVGVEGRSPLKPPQDSAKARRWLSAGEEATLGWRPGLELAIPGRAGWILQGKLGEGGFGEVWLARHVRTRENRVFKFCFDAGRLRSFKRELAFFRLLRERLGNRTDIAALLDVQVDAPPFYLESDYVETGNLLEWAESEGGIRQVPEPVRLRLIAKVARALAAAHSVGIIHKDVKPGNILISVDEDRNPLPKLCDFGIGMLADRSVLDDLDITRSGFTRTLVAAEDSSRTGTRIYSPPEYLVGGVPSIQGDIYALGILLYQMVVGDLARPLGSGWEREVADELLRDDIQRCVDFDPLKRLESAGFLAGRIETLEARREQMAAKRKSEARRHRNRLLARAAVVVLAGLAGLAGLLAAGFYRERGLRLRATTAEQAALTALARADRETYASKVRLAGSHQLAGQIGEMVCELESTDRSLRNWEWGHLMSMVPHPEWCIPAHATELNAFDLSRDKQWIATSGDKGLVRLWEASTRRMRWECRPVAGDGPVHGLRFFDNGRSLLAWNNSEVFVIGVEDGRVDHHVGGLWSPRCDGLPEAPVFFVAGGTGKVKRIEKSRDKWGITATSVAPFLWEQPGENEVGLLRLDESSTCLCLVSLGHGRRIVTLDAGNLNVIRRVQRPVDTPGMVGDLWFDMRGGDVWFAKYFSLFRQPLANWIQGDPAEAVTGFRSPCLFARPANDGELVAAAHGASEPLVRITGNKTAVCAHVGQPVVALARMGELIVTADASGRVRAWAKESVSLDRRTSHELWEMPRLPGALAASPDGRHLFTTPFSDTPGDVPAWVDVESGLGRFLPVGSSHRGTILFREKGGELALSRNAGTPVEVVDTRATPPLPLRTLNGMELLVRSDSSGGLFIGITKAAEGRPRQAAVGRWESMELLKTTPRRNRVTSVALSRDGKRAAAIHDGRAHLLVWETETGMILHDTKSGLVADDKGEIMVLARKLVFHPDGDTLAGGGADGRVHIWTIGEPGGVRKLPPCGGEILVIGFSGDGERLFVASGNNELQLWDWRIGRSLISFKTAYGPLSAEFMPDGRSLVFGDGGNPAFHLCQALPWTVDRDSDAFLAASRQLRQSMRQLIDTGAGCGDATKPLRCTALFEGLEEILLAGARALLKEDPDNVLALNDVAYLSALSGEDPAAALKLIVRARSLRPEDDALALSHAFILAACGRADEAVAEFRKREASPLFRTASVKIGYAEALRLAGESDEAQSVARSVVNSWGSAGHGRLPKEAALLRKILNAPAK